MNREGADRYFNWLVSQIQFHDGHHYTGVTSALFAKEFHWKVPNDDNRVEDGIDLRMEFFGEVDESMPAGCSVLEMLIGLARRMSADTGEDPAYTAWLLLRNLELDKLPDPLRDSELKMVDNILENLVWRTYRRDGVGGFFPLGFPDGDQRKVELWYQMAAYIEENYQN